MRERDIQQICQDTINSKFAGGMARWNSGMRGEAENETIEVSTRAGLILPDGRQLPAIRTAVLMQPNAAAWLLRVKQAVELRKQAAGAVALVHCEEGQGLNDGSFLDCCALVVPGICTDDLDALFMNGEHSPSLHSAFVALMKCSATLIQSLVRGFLARCLIRISFKHMQADQVRMFFFLLVLSVCSLSVVARSFVFIIRVNRPFVSYILHSLCLSQAVSVSSKRPLSAHWIGEKWQMPTSQTRTRGTKNHPYRDPNGIFLEDPTFSILLSPWVLSKTHEVFKNYA
jgi:hypothetical protein